MKKYLKNKKFIISSSLIIIAIISVIIVKYSTSVNSINRVNKVLPLNYYDISCIDDECEYIQAKKGDKLKKSKVVILDNNGKEIGKYNEVYNSKDKTDRFIYSVTKDYLIFNIRNRKNYKTEKYSLTKTNGKSIYNTTNKISVINDNLVKESLSDGYKIINKKGEVLYNDVDFINSYNESKLINIYINNNYLLLDENGKEILEGYEVDKEVVDNSDNIMFLILKDKKSNSFYYYDINENKIKNDSFQNYQIVRTDDEVKCIIDINENDKVVKYLLKENGKQVKYKDISTDDFIYNINSKLDDKYTLREESVVNINQKSVIVTNKKDNSVGSYNIKEKKYTALFKYKNGNSYNYSNIYKLDREKNKPYIQITCNDSNCSKSLLYVYDLNKEKVLYSMKDSDLVPSKYIEYTNGYKVIKYNYSSKKADYRGKYVLYDKNNKELLKTDNYIVVVGEELVFGSTYDNYVTLYSSKTKKMLNDDSSSASILKINNKTLYKYDNKNNTYLLSEKGKEIVKIPNKIKLIYSSDTISYVENNKINIINLNNNKIKTYKLKNNEKINDSYGDTIPPIKNSLIINNMKSNYVKVVGYNGNVVKKIKKQYAYGVKESTNGNIVIITKNIINNKVKYGLYIAK